MKSAQNEHIINKLFARIIKYNIKYSKQKNKMLNQRKIDDAFVNQAVNNMGYIYKDQAKQYITAFLNKQISFRPFDAIRNIGSNFIFFIELRGFIEIGNHHTHEVLIGIPKNFPQGPPNLLLSVNRAVFRINKQQQLMNNKQIFIQKDQKGVQFIRFYFPFLSYGWQPTTSLIKAYSQLKVVLNSPPLLTQINLQSNTVNKYKEWQQFSTGLNNQNKNKGPAKKQQANIEASRLLQIIDNKSIELSNSFSTLHQLENHKQKMQYMQSRNNYLLHEHLKDLESNIRLKRNHLIEKTIQVNEITEQSKSNNQSDMFLSVSQKDEKKLERMAEKQALKQAEKKVKQTVEEQLQSGNKKYVDYKKVIRSLFSQMFDNQTKILQSVQ